MKSLCLRMMMALFIVTIFAGCGKKEDNAMNDIEIEEGASKPTSRPKPKKQEITLPWESKTEEKAPEEDSDKPPEKSPQEKVRDRMAEIKQEIKDKEQEIANIHEEEKGLRGDVSMESGSLGDTVDSNMAKRRELRQKTAKLTKEIRKLKLIYARYRDILSDLIRKKKRSGK